MSPTASEVLKQALSLDEQDRASVAGALIESLEERADADVEVAWSKEIERRVRELEANSITTAAWSQVRDRLFRGFD